VRKSGSVSNYILKDEMDFWRVRRDKDPFETRCCVDRGIPGSSLEEHIVSPSGEGNSRIIQQDSRARIDEGMQCKLR
jgi:hypothetical protein